MSRAPVLCTTVGCPGDGRYASPGKGHLIGCQYPEGGLRIDENAIRDAAQRAAHEWNAIRTTRSPYEGFKAGYEKALRDMAKVTEAEGTRCAWCGDPAVRAVPSEGFGITYPLCGKDHRD